MEAAVTRQHAHQNTVFHCLYGYYNLGYTKSSLAHIYNKILKTISNWIRVYDETGTFERAASKTDKKFTESHRKWLFDFYQQRPLSFLDEAQEAFKRAHHISISISSVWRIIHAFGLTWKVLERRAMHIKEKGVFRFVEELSRIDWSYQNLVFLDEVSFDNRGMVRKQGKPSRFGDFSRKPRVSILAFIGVNGIIDYFNTEGTFDRVEFVKCCRSFAFSKRGQVRQYPGPNSVWILDGAGIHRHPDIVHFLRGIGVVPIFLPAYCPFFNPIEYLFGYVKKRFSGTTWRLVVGTFCHSWLKPSVASKRLIWRIFFVIVVGWCKDTLILSINWKRKFELEREAWMMGKEIATQMKTIWIFLLG
eukprot:jgi/Phyca11/118488/e_gw1.36.361.1